MNINKEIRIMHACELGATGVYRGHKCTARYFFRANLSDLDSMRLHEKDHASFFRNLLEERNARPCFAHQLFFIGGLFYGVAIGLFGLKSIGTSTYTIEEIVNHELDYVLEKLKSDSELCKKIRAIQLEEQQHSESGRGLIGNNYFLYKSIKRIAKAGAYTAKHLASLL